MTHDTTDAAAHVEAIRAALDDGYDPLDDWEYLSAKNRDAICDHAAALDAARVAAEQRADAWDAEAHILVDKLGDVTIKLAEAETRADAAEQRADAAEADLKAAEDRGDRYFEALKCAIPGHYQHVLWFHYTADRWSIYDKFKAWVESDKNTVGPFDMEHWFRVFGLKDGDWYKGEPGDLDDEPAPARADGGTR